MHIIGLGMRVAVLAALAEVERRVEDKYGVDLPPIEIKGRGSKGNRVSQAKRRKLKRQGRKK